MEVLRWYFLFLGGTLSQQFQKVNEPGMRGRAGSGKEPGLNEDT